MRLTLFSDLHTEFYSDPENEWFFSQIDPSGADVAVLAGDILLGRNSLRFYERMSKLFKHCVAVAGNHEYYQGNFDSVQRRLHATGIPNFHFLERETVTIEGQRFVGCTLWYNGGMDCILNEKCMNDFRMINKEGGYRNFIYRYAQESKFWLEETVKSDDVVVTHMLPSERCIDSDYVGDLMNGFYYHNCEHILANNRPKLWLHGHSHNHYDEILHETRVVRNPHGYPGESNTNFDKSLRITV